LLATIDSARERGDSGIRPFRFGKHVGAVARYTVRAPRFMTTASENRTW